MDASTRSVHGEEMSIEARTSGFERALESGDLSTATAHYHAIADLDPVLAVRLGMRQRLVDAIARSGGHRPFVDEDGHLDWPTRRHG